ncbi:MAG: DUF5941 domain-containing protein [Candidatus Nanopelagicales bacterium]
MRALVRPGPSGASVLAEVDARLARLGVDDVRHLPDGECAEQVAAIAAGLAGRTLIIDGELIVADASLGQLVDDPAVRTGALLIGGAPDDGAESSVPVRVVQRRVASAGSAAHDVTAPSAGFLGALVVDRVDLEAARGALEAAAVASSAAGWPSNAVDVALVALVRTQIPVSAVISVGPAMRGGTASARDAILAELDGMDQARVLLERANRPDDGFYSTFVLRRASKPVTATALRLGLSPNQISLFSLAVGLCAAACFAVGSWPALLAGAVLMQASLIIDCVDGEVARFTRSFSDLGAWLDAATDRVKEYAAYAGLAAGSVRHGRDIWLLATLVMIMQTIRHVGDYDFARVQRIRESWVPARPIGERSDGGAAGSGATLDLSAQLNRNSRVRWFKKVLHMPIGERWLVLSVGAVLLGPRRTLVLLLCVGIVALAYTTVGRVLRARMWHHPPDRSGAWLLRPQLGFGPVGEPIWSRMVAARDPLAGAFGWAWPAGMRIVELSVAWLAAAAVLPDGGAWCFAWVFVVVFHHYDVLYRALGGSSPPRWLVWVGLGWDGRTVLVALCALSGAAALTGLFQAGAAILGLLFVVVASVQWVRSMKGGSHV